MAPLKSNILYSRAYLQQQLNGYYNFITIDLSMDIVIVKPRPL